MEYYIRIKGTNLDNLIFDTRHLSVVRGGALLLLDAVSEAKKHVVSEFPQLSFQEMNTGASSGILCFHATCAEALRVRDAVADFYRADPHLKNATITVDIVSAPDSPAEGQTNFPEVRAALVAKNRWRQMQAGTVVIPEQNTKENAAVCELDGVRPATEIIERKKDHSKEAPASHFTFERHQYGRKQKKHFYQERCGSLSIEFEFAREFEEIAAGGNPGELPNKMAVFYADGNGFGRLQNELCESRSKQKEFDGVIRKNRRELLCGLLENEILRDPAWLNPNCLDQGKQATRIRFETLLLGGDEFMFAMPAKLGWRFAKLFFQAVEKEVNGKHDWQFDGHRLTLTAALVFSHHHAPIHRLKALAKDKMCEMAKQQNRQRNQLVCQVLESFDHLGTDYQTAMKMRLGPHFDLKDWVLHGEGQLLHKKIEVIADTVAGLKQPGSDFPRGKLRALVSDLVGIPADSPGETSNRQKFEKLADFKARTSAFLPLSSPFPRETFETFRSFFASDAACWIHLEELWDYARQ